MIDAQNKLQLFFDTNFLESRFDKDKLYLSEFKISKDYYDLVNYIKEHDLEEKIDICMPEVVLREIKEHLLLCFKSEKDSLNSKIEIFKKMFGGLLDIDYKVSIERTEDYIEYIDNMIDKSSIMENCKIIQYPRNSEIIDNIVDKALRTQRPFAKAKGKKEYTDAGFKDALIVETIVEHCKKNDKQGAFVTKDRDFEDILGKMSEVNVKELFGFEQAKSYIYDLFNLEDVSMIKKEFEKNAYLKESVFLEAGQKMDSSVTKYEIIDVIKVPEQDNIYNIVIDSLINETEYHFNVNYDQSANEIVNVIYEIKNE